MFGLFKSAKRRAKKKELPVYLSEGINIHVDKIITEDTENGNMYIWYDARAYSAYDKRVISLRYGNKYSNLYSLNSHEGLIDNLVCCIKGLQERYEPKIRYHIELHKDTTHDIRLENGVYVRTSKTESISKQEAEIITIYLKEILKQ